MRGYERLSDNEIIEVIKEYINDSIYNYAVLIDGDWGSGKSYFIKEHLIPEIENDIKQSSSNEKKLIFKLLCKRLNKKEERKEKQFIYISLYGIKSTEEISKQIYTNFFMNKTNNNKVVKRVVSTGSKVLSDLVSLTGIDITKYRDDLESFINLDKYILIFDDLERCNCDVNEVLGYINNFVEHDGIKVILVANEKEIGKNYQCRNQELRYLLASKDNINIDINHKSTQQNSSEINNSNQRLQGESEHKKDFSVNEIKTRAKYIFDKNLVYEKVKEKLIGITIKYEPDLKLIHNNLINEHIEDNDLKLFIQKALEKNIDYAHKEEHINLRTYQFYLSKINNINKRLKDENGCKYKNYDIVMPCIVEYCYKVCIAYKSGQYKEKWVDGESFKCNISENFGGKYNFKYRFVDEYILYGKLNSEEMINTIELFLHEKQEYENNPEDIVYKLECWWELRDNEAKELMDKCIENLYNNKYTNDKLYKILKIFVSLESIGFNSKYLNKVIEYFKKTVNNGMMIYLEDFTSMIDDKNIKNKYIEIVNELKKIAEQENKRDIEKDINECLSDNEKWAKNLYDYVILDANYKRQDKSFIEIIGLENLISKITESSSYNISFFRYTISQFYDCMYTCNRYIDDRKNIQILINSLKELDKTNFDNIKNKNIHLLINVLEEKYTLFNNQNL